MPRPNIEKGIKERIRYALSVKKKSISSITEDDSERIAFGRQINKEDTSISACTIYKVLYALHDISADWLILGEGSMHKTVDCPQIFNQQHYEMQNGQNNSGTINFGDTVIPYPVQALLDEKDKRIAELEKDKKQLQGLLSVFTRQAEAVAPKKKMKNSDAD